MRWGNNIDWMKVRFKTAMFPLVALVDADRARHLFNSAHDIVRLRQCLTFMARLHHHLDNREERNRYAKQFRNLETEYPKISSASSNGYRAFWGGRAANPPPSSMFACRHLFTCLSIVAHLSFLCHFYVYRASLELPFQKNDSSTLEWTTDLVIICDSVI